MAGTDQQIMNTLTKNLGIDSDGNLTLRNIGLVLEDGKFVAPSIRASSMFSGLDEKVIQKTNLMGEELPVDWGKLTEDNGSQVLSVADKETGVFQAESGTDNDGKAGIHAQLNWMGDKNVIFECRVETPATITNYKLELGFNDNLTAEVWGTLAEDGSGDTSTDAIVFIWDTDKHATKLWAAGTKNGTGWGGIDLGVTMEASTVYDFRIELTDDNALMYYKKVGTHTTWQLLHTVDDNTTLTKTADLTPWLLVVTRTTANRTLNFHRVGVEQDI